MNDVQFNLDAAIHTLTANDEEARMVWRKMRSSARENEHLRERVEELDIARRGRDGIIDRLTHELDQTQVERDDLRGRVRQLEAAIKEARYALADTEDE